MDPTVVNIVIGRSDAKKTFTMHKELLCYHSEWFRKAFNGDWRESEEDFLHLKGIPEEVFRVVSHWLYAQSFRVATPDSPTLEETPAASGSHKRHRGRLCACGRCPTSRVEASETSSKPSKATWLKPSGKALCATSCTTLSSKDG